MLAPRALLVECPSSMRQERKTPDYTTSWKDMPMVLA